MEGRATGAEVRVRGEGRHEHDGEFGHAGALGWLGHNIEISELGY